MSSVASTQANLLDRLLAVEDALNQPLLIDRMLTDASHNSRAGLLRNGLMVVAFTSLEDFIRARCRQLLGHVSRTVVRFDDLPDALRDATVFEAMRAANEQARMAKRAGDDPFPIAQQAAADVASTAGGALSLSGYSIGHSSSNISSDEIEKALKCFQVMEPWPQLDALAHIIGSGGPPLRPQYDQAQRLRNMAAHDTRANVQPADLLGFCQRAKSLAVAFDLLASHNAQLLHMGDASVLQGRLKPAATMTLAFVDEGRRGFSERRSTAKRAAKVSPSFDSAWTVATRRAQAGRYQVVARDRAGRPVRWAPVAS